MLQQSEPFSSTWSLMGLHAGWRDAVWKRAEQPVPAHGAAVRGRTTQGKQDGRGSEPAAWAPVLAVTLTSCAGCTYSL